jgi:hemoglobin-like flavoprotein
MQHSKGSKTVTLTDHQKELVLSSYQHLIPTARQFANDFYTRLFELAPETRTLFPADLSEQTVKFTYTLRTLVIGLNRLDDIEPVIQDLGRRHTKYQVKPEHYVVLGNALLWTLESSLKDEFTPEVHDAWSAVYNLIAKVAVDAAY